MILGTSKKKDGVSGFTLIELLICVSIFVFMTVLLVAKYGNFNQSVLLTDLAYDTALTLRQAQSYGLSVTASKLNDLSAFQYAYGVDFAPISSSINDNSHLVLYADTSPLGSCTYNGNPCPFYDTADTMVSSYAVKRGAIVGPTTCAYLGTNTTTCVGETGATKIAKLDVAFKRPDPSAIICVVIQAGSTNIPTCSVNAAKIVLLGTDGSTRTVIVRNNGQITVQN